MTEALERPARNRRQLGTRLEKIASYYLEQQGYETLYRQYRCPLGEIDLVMRDGNTTVFVEVKGRHTERFGLPREAVDWRKRRRLWRVAEHFLQNHNYQSTAWRFDVVEIYLLPAGRCRINHIPAAFDGINM